MKFNSVEEKFIRLGLDPGALGNEIHTSAQMLFKSLRDRKVSAETFLNGSTGGPEPFDYGNVIMPLKKYRGETIRAVAEKDPSYLMWVIENVTSNPLLVRQCTEYMKQKFGL